MKLRKEFVKAIINDRVTNASQWQLQIERIQSNYVIVTGLLKKEEVLSPEVIRHSQELQQQLIRLLAQFVSEMDELEENTATSDSNAQALFDRHIQRMSELNGRIHIFFNSLPPAPVS